LQLAQSPLVSIAMPAFNAGTTLSLAIRSLLLQTHANWELLLMDDGSTDATVAVARSFADSRIRVFSDSRRLGLAARLNQAIDCSHGEYLARLDADDLAYPERLEVQVSFLQHRPEVDLVGSAGLVFGFEGAPIGLLPVHESHEAICHNPWSGFYLPHPTWMGKMTWFRKHYYRAEAIKAQDQDLLLRTYQNSQFAGLPQLLIGYRQDKLSIRKILTSRYHFARAITRAGVQGGNYQALAGGLAMQIVKGLVDMAALSTGLEHRILSHRAQPLPADAIRKWEEVWCACHEELPQSCVA